MSATFGVAKKATAIAVRVGVKADGATVFDE